MQHLRDDEEDEAVVEDEAHDLRPVPARHRDDTQLECRQGEHREVEAHRVNECRGQQSVVGIRDGTSLARNPGGLKEDT